jgi:hypothetical protein
MHINRFAGAKLQVSYAGLKLIFQARVISLLTCATNAADEGGCYGFTHFFRRYLKALAFYAKLSYAVVGVYYKTLVQRTKEENIINAGQQQ